MIFLIDGFRQDLLFSRFFLLFTAPHGQPRPCGIWRRKAGGHGSVCGRIKKRGYGAFWACLTGFPRTTP